MSRRPLDTPALRRRPPTRILGALGWSLALFAFSLLPAQTHPAQTHPAPLSTTVAPKAAPAPPPTPAPSPQTGAANVEKILPRGTAFIQPGDYVFVLPDGRKIPIKLGPISMITVQR